MSQNVVGRFIAFPVSDLQANSDISFNVTKLAAATADFSGENGVKGVVQRLSSNGTDKLLGNAAFWASDYMVSTLLNIRARSSLTNQVHRRDNFVLGNKMISNRSHNTEYTNSANPYGNHLGQGTLFSYVTGREYLDIEAGWDWNLIPGTTVLLDYPRLNISGANVGVTGKKNYVGVVSDGWVGTSVMDYVDPLDGSLAYRKAWFYLDDSVVVMTTAISINSSVSAAVGRPVISVLDNRASAGSTAMLDGQAVTLSNSTKVNATTLYYGGYGYLSYGSPFDLTLSEGNRTGNWSTISTSTVGVNTVPIFSAYTTLQPGRTSAYAFFPATSPDVLESERQSASTTTLVTNGTLAVAGLERLSIAFWPGSGTSMSVSLSVVGWASSGLFTVTSVQPAIYLFATRLNDDGTRTAVITFSDPSQSLGSLSFFLDAAQATKVSCARVDWNDGCEAFGSGVKFVVNLPRGGLAGSSSFREVVLG